MHLPAAPLLLILLTSTSSTARQNHHAHPVPRHLDGLLVEPTYSTPSPSSSPKPFLKHLDLREIIPRVPYLKHLDIRQQAAGAAAAPAAGAQQQQAAPAAGANKQAAAPAAGANQQAAAPAAAPAAPVAGVGGGGAPAAQPVAGAQANSVTTEMVQTVVGGVTKTVEQVFTQTFGAAGSAPPVKTGSIGMGTLTGKVGVVKTDTPKSEGAPSLYSRRWTIVGIIGSWVAAMMTVWVQLGPGVI